MIRLIGEIFEFNEMFNKQPLFMMNGNPNAFQKGKR